MDKGPLVAEEIEAGARFLREFSQYLPVQAAFWLRANDELVRFLYVASDQITDENFDAAYREAGRIERQLQDPWWDPMRLKLIGAADPLAKATLDLQRRYPGRAPLRLCDESFGGVIADDLYLYPTSSPATVT